MPMFNIIMIVIVAVTAFIWGTRTKGRGLFSSLINLVCVIASGAVAFAVWEPLAYAFGLDMLRDLGWMIALLAPFIVTQLVLRLIIDQLLPKNLEFDDISNFIGGAVFGAGAGVLTAGIIAIAMGFGRFGPNMLGYKPIEQQSGNMVVTSKLWIPVDRLTAEFYEFLSVGAFSTSTPMARYLPNPDIQASMQRMVFVEETSDKKFLAENNFVPEAFEVIGRYTVQGKLDALLADSQNPNRKQVVIYPDGTKPSEGAHIEGYVVRFNTNAFEKKGQVVVGAAQARLLVSQKPGGPSRAVHPFAAITPADSTAVNLARFRFDGPDVYMASQGGASSAMFAFEFLVDAGYTGHHLILKNVRKEIGDAPLLKDYTSVSERDSAVTFGEILGSSARGDIVDINKIDVSGRITLDGGANGFYKDILATDRLPDNFVLISGQQGGIELDDQKRVVGGYVKMNVRDAKPRGVDRNLRVDKFSSTATRGIVQVTLAEDGNLTPIGQVLVTKGIDTPPILIDKDGGQYAPVGYVYSDGSFLEISFTPQRQLLKAGDLPTLTASRRDQSLWVIYWPTKKAFIDQVVSPEHSIAVLAAPGLEVR